LSLHDIHAVIDQAVSLVEHQPSYRHIQVVRRYASAVPQVSIDAGQMQQVFVNLFINAGEAMPDGGHLTITTRRLHAPEPTGVDAVQVQVRDTGAGIPEDCLSKIFDPFFTSKEVGQGIGLGLAVSYGIVERHNGAIEVASEVGQGSTFTITLPCECGSE
jgi:two-component system NtrC family sensor kinase